MDSELEKHFKVYKEAVRNKSNGFLALIDIIDSTKRKEEYKDEWVPQTKLLYDISGDIYKRISKKFKYVFNRKNSYRKNIGDACLLFFGIPIEADDNTERNEKIAKSIYDECAEVDYFLRRKSNETNKLRVKIVFAFLTNIYKIADAEGTKKEKLTDVLGRGVDFCFRLEKYAKATHFVCNKMFHDLLPKK